MITFTYMNQFSVYYYIQGLQSKGTLLYFFAKSVHTFARFIL